MAGVIVLGLMILAILLAPLYMPYEEMIRQDVFNKLQPPSAQHPLGTDELGRDLLARVLYGGRISLLGGMATIAIAFTAGCIIGGVPGRLAGGRGQQKAQPFHLVGGETAKCRIEDGD